MRKSIVLSALVLTGCCFFDGNGEIAATAVSPDGRSEIRLWTDPLACEVVRDGRVVVARSEIGLKVDGRCLVPGETCRVEKASRGGTVGMPVYKKAKIDLAANETFVDFGDWGVRLFSRNDGVAYRFETKFSGEITVEDERFDFRVPDEKAECLVYHTGNYGCEESVAALMPAGEVRTQCGGKTRGWIGSRCVYLPFAYTVGGTVVSVTDADVNDYPILNFVRPASVEAPVFAADFAKFPSVTANNSKEIRTATTRRQRHWIVKETEDFLVRTAGTRVFPWRLFQLADSYSGLCASDAVVALARPQVGLDFSWVKPGKVAWDWWNAFDNQGNAGCNTKTYERFIDFAAKTGVEYVIFDEGWSESLNIWKFHPNVDVPHLIDYAAKRNVGIVLWMAWAQVVGDEEHVASHFAKLGAKGFKVDFMDRGDAEVERFLWKFADACARHRMVLDYHGAHRPTGMSRAYPNVLNYEGIHGLEQMKWFRGGYDFTQNDVAAFFGRLTAGPMDYTPGAMCNYPVGRYPKKSKTFDPYVNPGSEGTRCHQMAMMVLYEAPLQMLSDSPTNYGKNMESFSFMAATPVVWADTIGLGGCPRTFAAVARRARDGAWYAAAVNASEARDYTLDTSFLGPGRWKAEIFRDAADSGTAPTHYVHEKDKPVNAGEKLNFRLAPGGGFIVKFTK